MKNGKVFLEGLRDGVPIGLGYFAVAFSLGIVARNAGLTPIQGFIASFFNLASAGEYALFTSMQAAASFLEIAIITLVVNARYLLNASVISAQNLKSVRDSNEKYAKINVDKLVKENARSEERRVGKEC